MKRIVHVNQHVIKSNRKNNVNDPVLTCKTYKDTVYGYEIEMTGPTKIIYRPDKPLSCGAHVWIKTHDPIIIDGKKEL